MVNLAEQEQIGYGYFDGGGLQLKVPRSMNLNYDGDFNAPEPSAILAPA